MNLQKWFYQFRLPPLVYETSHLFTSLPTVELLPNCCDFNLIINVYMFLSLATDFSSMEMSVVSFAHCFPVGRFLFFLTIGMLYILDTTFFSVTLLQLSSDYLQLTFSLYRTFIWMVVLSLIWLNLSFFFCCLCFLLV